MVAGNLLVMEVSRVKIICLENHNQVIRAVALTARKSFRLRFGSAPSGPAKSRRWPAS